MVRVGVASSRVEALWAPLTSWPWEGMTRERVTLVLLVLWALEYGTETGYTRPPAAWGGRAVGHRKWLRGIPGVVGTGLPWGLVGAVCEGRWAVARPGSRGCPLGQ